uniref:G_PROTEIN_RECEP_F1_2 domain-containing protein n=1 Tax=Globodera rostochiensis TaxID=31243 RepID=A0A914I2F0_GLORO
MSAVNASSDDAIYLAYRFAGPSADLIVPAAVLYAVAAVGIVSNATVLVVTVKSGFLRGSANFLMSMLCMFELIHQTGHTFFLVVVISGTNFVSLLTAGLFMAPMIFALNCGLMAIFCAAFDRLLAVAATHLHKEIYLRFKYAYLLAHLFVCTLYGAFTLNYVLVYAFENAGNPTTGVVAETLLGSVGYKFFAGAVILSLCSICCNVAIFVIICSKNGVSQETNTRLVRSLVIILSISIGGYLFSLALYQLLYAFGHLFGSPIQIWQLSFIGGVLLNAGAAANAPVLYFNSTEYRRVFKKEWRALTESFGMKNAVQNITATQVRSTNPNKIHSRQQMKSIQINRH